MADPMLLTLSVVTAVVLGGVLLMWVRQFSCASSKPDALLPKGSFGWPLVGETLAFLRGPAAFSHSRVKRYGSVFFKTHIVLRHAIMGTTPEFAKFVASKSNLFKAIYPKQVMELMGPKAFVFKDGAPHQSVKKLVIRALRAETLENHVHALETIVVDHLAAWEHSTDTVIAKEATKKLTWDTTNWVLFGDTLRANTPEGLKNFENFKQIMRAFVSIPLNVPGTTYARSLKAKTALIADFKLRIKQSRSQMKTQSAFFEALLATRDDPEQREELKELYDDSLADSMLAITFAAFGTTLTTLLWTLKFLVDYPDVCRRIQAEQQEILKNKDPSVKGPRLTWDDTRNMIYTQKFYQEVHRFVSLAPLVFREATEDIKFEGYLIPKGWVVCPMLKHIHSDPKLYPDLGFNPDRFDVLPKPYTFLPYFAGTHMCPGIEQAKLTALIFIHHLTTNFMVFGISLVSDCMGSRGSWNRKENGGKRALGEDFEKEDSVGDGGLGPGLRTEG